MDAATAAIVTFWIKDLCALSSASITSTLLPSSPSFPFRPDLPTTSMSQVRFSKARSHGSIHPLGRRRSVERNVVDTVGNGAGCLIVLDVDLDPTYESTGG